MTPRPGTLLCSATLAAILAGAAPAHSADRLLPLPDAPVRLVIPDAVAFDAALTGSFRSALTREIDANDPVVAAWRLSPVGSKLEDQWSKLAADLPWTWNEIRKLQPRAVGVALLSAGALEAVVVVDTPLALLPASLPAGTPKTHAAVAYALVARGAGDAVGDDRRRAGFAWARHQGRLFLATSERALLLALDEAVAGRGTAAFLPGLASLELDLDRLRKDRYFVREFAFGIGADEGRIHAALRLEEGRIVEVREGHGPRAAAAATFDAKVEAAGWEPSADGFARAVRAGLLEALPTLADRPRPPLVPLPATAGSEADRYLVRLDRPAVEAQAPWEEGDLAAWRLIADTRPAPGWGWAADRLSGRAVLFAWPSAQQTRLEQACRDTLARLAGPVTEARMGEVLELRVGPGLPALALRRAGDFVWLGTSARAVAGLGVPRPAGDLVRWARVDLGAVRGETERWARAEGPASPERVRSFSDRVLGLLGWMPSVRGIAVERRQGEAGWTERVVFETR